jgi:AmmeMemoRadiSam system protein A
MLDETDKITLLKLARLTLQSYFDNGAKAVDDISRVSLLEKKAAFVSLHNREDLRGCIGQLYPDRELYKIVQNCVLSAALEDSRFAPVRREELPDLNIEISVLSPFHRIRDIQEIQIGKHGIYLVSGGFQGLLLPQVAANYGWDRLTFLQQTSRKAGLRESAWREKHSVIHIFEAEVFDERTVPKIA